MPTSPNPKKGERSSNLLDVSSELLEFVFNGLFEILGWLIEALLNSLLLLFLGGIAVNIVGGMLQGMAPALPPGMDDSVVLGQGTALFQPAGSWLVAHKFMLVFLLVASATLIARFTRRNQPGVPAGPASRTRKIVQRFSEQWFELIVVNAFVALGIATALAWMQRFSYTSMLYDWFVEPMVGTIRLGVAYVLGERTALTLENWFAWYGVNQFKFTFWFLYLASICDDLGVPNIKTLARYIWRRIEKRKQAKETKPLEGASSANP